MNLSAAQQGQQTQFEQACLQSNKDQWHVGVVNLRSH